jgi:hypothetical protein
MAMPTSVNLMVEHTVANGEAKCGGFLWDGSGRPAAIVPMSFQFISNLQLRLLAVVPQAGSFDQLGGTPVDGFGNMDRNEKLRM